MDVSTGFLRDEVRSGFYVPTAIKQVWASQLKVLSEIDRVCKKHNITYFAEWGSLLGAVRHGGFVPWDDDLDISMLREDFQKFMEVADEELPRDFAIHNYERHEGHWLFLSRVVNSNHICFDEEHLDKYYNFPYIASVDIFVLDYLYRDEEDERKRCDEIKHILAVADGISLASLKEEVIQRELEKIEVQYKVQLCDKMKSYGRGWRLRVAVDLYRLAEEQMGRVTEAEADSVGQIFPWIMKGGKGLPKDLYSHGVSLPFEEGVIPVPGGYHKILTSRYGDYLKVHKVWGGHDYPYFEKQKEALKSVLDFEMPEFRYERGMFRGEATSQRDCRQLEILENSIRGMVKSALLEVEANIDAIRESVFGGELGHVLEILPQIQQLAIDLGGFVETVKGEEAPSTKEIVACLEEFCEALYVFYGIVEKNCDGNPSGKDYDTWLRCGEDFGQGEVSECLKSLLEIFSKTRGAVCRWILDRRVVLFVSVGADWWSGFSDIYNTCLKSGSEIHVVFTPMFRKNALGDVKINNKELALSGVLHGYPKEIDVRNWSDYNLELENPDVIYFQNPYDGENPCLTVPSEFYSKNLQTYSKKLVYVPAFSVEEFVEKDTTAVYNMKHYVTAPGLMYADEILVQSENMKRMWIDKLVEFVGEETKAVWENKLIVRVKEKSKPAVSTGKKRLLFVVGVNEAFESGEEFVPRLKKKMKIFDFCKSRLEVDLCLYPANKTAWENAVKENYIGVEEILDGWNMNFVEKVGDAYLDKYDAYYGSPSPYAHEMSCVGKPVMIMDIEI